MTRSAATLLLALTCASALQAQREPRRPHLPADADTNDASAYFQLGLDRIQSDPRTASAAFYWASRLDPMSPQTVYALGTAELLRDRTRMVRTLEGDEPTLALAAVHGIDSLRFRAEMQDPFLHRGLDQVVYDAWASSQTHGDDFLGRGSHACNTVMAGEDASRSGARVQCGTEQFLEANDPFARGLYAYSRGELRSALGMLSAALRGHDADWVWAERARIWMELRQPDSAAASMRQALQHTGARMSEQRKHLYYSAAAWQFALGRILEDRRDTAAAREAYERSMGADQAYYPATIRLSVLAIQQGDTAMAVGALNRVVQLPGVQFFACTVSATILNRVGHRSDAIAALRRATTLEPLASAGWLMLGRTLESSNDSTGAADAYSRFLALAPVNDAARINVTASLSRLHRTP